MLTNLVIKNFKCFREETHFEFKNINLLTGTNSAGKSSMLQPILVMWQSVDRNTSTETIYFNGSYVELGTFQHIRNANTLASEPISWTFTFRSASCDTAIKYTLNAAYGGMSAHIDRLNIKINIGGIQSDITFDNHVDPDESPGSIAQSAYTWDHLLPVMEPRYELELNASSQAAKFHRIHYTSADRLGPQDHYEKHSIGEFVHAGARGEQIGSVLYTFKDEPVAKALCIGQDEGVPSTLQDQTEAWLARVFGHARVQPIDTGANIILLELGTDIGKQRFRPKNVGFGYSMALPIIISCLLAKPGDILIVENPEAHLHPAAQSSLMQLLLKVSALDVQVFIESHSDHILNSLRVAMKHGNIHPDSAAIYYFSRSAEKPIQKLKIDSDGSIESWPYGFFDQTDRDYYELFGV